MHFEGVVESAHHEFLHDYEVHSWAAYGGQPGSDFRAAKVNAAGLNHHKQVFLDRFIHEIIGLQQVH